MAVRFLHGCIMEESINTNWISIGESSLVRRCDVPAEIILRCVHHDKQEIKERQKKKPKIDSPKDEVASSVHGSIKCIEEELFSL